MSVTFIQRDQNNNVSLVRMNVSDNLATVGQADYIANNQEAINALNGGTFGWYTTDMILVAASDGNAFFQFTDDTFKSLIIYGEQGSGTVLPGMENDICYYPANGTTIGPIDTADSAVLITNAFGVPSLSQSLPSVVQANITQVGIISSGAWQGTQITVPYGGTGNDSFTPYGVVCGGTTSVGNLQNVSGVGTSGQVLTSNGASALPTWQNNAASGTVNSGTANQVAYYASNGTAVSGAALGQGLAISSSTLDVGGANNIPFNNGQGIQDNNSNKLLTFGVTGSAVNYAKISNNSTGNPPIVQALGSDTNVQLELKGQGNLGVSVQGRSDGNASSSGYLGETISSLVTSGSSITLTTSGNVYNVTSISLTAGNWSITGNYFLQNSSQAMSIAIGCISSSSASLTDASLLSISRAASALLYQFGTPVVAQNVSISSTTTYYLCVSATFGSGTTTGCGLLQATRIS